MSKFKIVNLGTNFVPRLTIFLVQAMSPYPLRGFCIDSTDKSGGFYNQRMIAEINLR